MKIVGFAILWLATAAISSTSLLANDGKEVSYGPAVVTLDGTISEEGYGEDPSPMDRGKRAWILHLAQPITVPAKPGDEIDTEEKNVTEIHLIVDHSKYRIPRIALRKTLFRVNGTLHHGINIHHLRPIMMIVTDLKPIRAQTR